MNQRIKAAIAGFFIVLGIVVTTWAPAASALEVPCDSGSAADCNIVKGDGSRLDTRVWFIVRTALGMIGGIAVIVIIIGGFLYVTSNGDVAKAKRARNTILYAVVGLIVSVSASAIITLVNNALK